MSTEINPSCPDLQIKASRRQREGHLSSPPVDYLARLLLVSRHLATTVSVEIRSERRRPMLPAPIASTLSQTFSRITAVVVRGRQVSWLVNIL